MRISDWSSDVCSSDLGVEKIIAWGGFDSVKHITRYLQPGIDLITQDPKLSGTIIGKEAFADEATLRHVAKRLALDIGAQNQEGCVSARVIYVESGTRSEEHTSELQSLMRNSYAVFCLKKKK